MKYGNTFYLGCDEINSATSEKQTLSRKEVIRRLRDRGEPITLFGESELDSFKRLRRSEVAEPESNKVRIFDIINSISIFTERNLCFRVLEMISKKHWKKLIKTI